jgi:hypothetical protein
VLVEYDRRAASRWVPYPIPTARLPALAGSAGLSPFTVTATRRSAFGGVLYAAAADVDRDSPVLGFVAARRDATNPRAVTQAGA